MSGRMLGNVSNSHCCLWKTRRCTTCDERGPIPRQSKAAGIPNPSTQCHGTQAITNNCNVVEEGKALPKGLRTMHLGSWTRQHSLCASPAPLLARWMLGSSTTAAPTQSTIIANLQHGPLCSRAQQVHPSLKLRNVTNTAWLPMHMLLTCTDFASQMHALSHRQDGQTVRSMHATPTGLGQPQALVERWPLAAWNI